MYKNDTQLSMFLIRYGNKILFSDTIKEEFSDTLGAGNYTIEFAAILVNYKYYNIG